MNGYCSITSLAFIIHVLSLKAEAQNGLEIQRLLSNHARMATHRTDARFQ